MDGKWLFPHLNGVINHALVAQMETLLHFKGFWMYLENPFSDVIDEISLIQLIKIFATILLLLRADLILWGFLDAF
jgi:hypothetical protein